MENRVNDIITVVIFIIILFLVPLSFYVFKDNISVTNTENRKLYQKPELNLAHLSEFPKEYDKYYSDNMPYRGLVQKLWANVNFGLFNTTISDRVLIGKNEGEKSSTWLFYKDEKDGNPVREAQGVIDFDAETIKNILENINENTNKLRQNNIELFYCVIPNKENVYKEKLPNSIKIFNDETRTDRLAKLLIDDNQVGNFIYTKQELIDAKEYAQTYYKQDTHWNSYGSFVGFKKIMNIIEPNYDNFDINITSTEKDMSIKDLVKMSNVTNFFKDFEVEVEFLENNKYTIEDGKGSIKITKCDEAVIDKTLLIVGDSFRNNILQYFSKVYKRVICMHRNDYNSDLIQKYSPDIVISEFVERYAAQIGHFKF